MGESDTPVEVRPGVWTLCRAEGQELHGESRKLGQAEVSMFRTVLLFPALSRGKEGKQKDK